MRPLPLPSFDLGAVVMSLGLVMLAFAGAAAANAPGSYRYVLALALAANLVLVSVRWPRAGILATFLFLPFLALVRRLLIADSGWTSYDPLLLVAPAVALFLTARIFLIEGRRIATDTNSMLVLALLVLALLQSFNPMLGSFAAGAGGFMFLGVPLLWFFVGRELADRRLVNAVLYAIVALAVFIGFYGLWQKQFGLPSWDQAWVGLNGYIALTLYGVTRAFGTFSSSAEYAIFLAAAVAIALALFLHGRSAFALPIPFLAFPIFYASGRGVLVLGMLACLLLVGLRSGNVRVAIAVVVVGLLGAALAVKTYVEPGQTAATATNPLTVHQLSGLRNPLDPEHSTLLVHLDLVVEGVKQGVTHPFGQGTAVTNIAADRFGTGSSVKGTEVDFSNAFVSLGLAGGLLFLAIAIATFRTAIRLYTARKDPLVLAIVGVLIVTLGQWLNGGYYALAPLTWFLIGWLSAQAATRGEDDARPAALP